MSDPMKVRVDGPLAEFVPVFRERLRAAGYRRDSVADQVRLVADLSRWLTSEGVPIGKLGPAERAAFIAWRQSSGRRCLRSVKALVPFLEHLRAVGAVGPDRVQPPAADERLLEEFASFLRDERALTAGTAAGYVHCVRRFVIGMGVDGDIDFGGVDAAAVVGFVTTACPGRSKGSAKLIVSSLRALLRWLFLTGRVNTDLSSAVPSVAGWRLAGVPRALEPDEVARLLAVFDRSTAAGRRDAAMTLLMVRVGLRAGEVARLGLSDIDWRAGELTVRGKGSRLERMPIPVDVGEAIVAYLQRGRPPTADGRTVFVRVHAPHGGLSTGAVTDTVCRAARRAGLGLVHAHVLRHTAATGMVRAGASLPEVGQVLRHRLLLTTSIYAKVDVEGLRTLARSWPGSLT